MYSATEFLKDLNKEQTKPFKFGVVTSTSPLHVKFDGETEASTETIPRLSSYTPVVNDRVLMIDFNGLIIIGSIT